MEMFSSFIERVTKRNKYFLKEYDKKEKKRVFEKNTLSLHVATSNKTIKEESSIPSSE